MTAAFYAFHSGVQTQVFDLATVKMRGLLSADQPEDSWNESEDDEFQGLVNTTGVIYKNKVEQTCLRYKSCCSLTSIVNLSNDVGDD